MMRDALRAVELNELFDGVMQQRAALDVTIVRGDIFSVFLEDVQCLVSIKPDKARLCQPRFLHE
jgi:hypothetical protein